MGLACPHMSNTRPRPPDERLEYPAVDYASVPYDTAAILYGLDRMTQILERIEERLGVDVTPSPVYLSRGRAAAMLDVSLESFERHVQPFLGTKRIGRLRLVRADDLYRWAARGVDRPERRTPRG